MGGPLSGSKGRWRCISDIWSFLFRNGVMDMVLFPFFSSTYYFFSLPLSTLTLM